MYTMRVQQIGYTLGDKGQKERKEVGADKGQMNLLTFSKCTPNKNEQVHKINRKQDTNLQ